VDESMKTKNNDKLERWETASIRPRPKDVANEKKRKIDEKKIDIAEKIVIFTGGYLLIGLTIFVLTVFYKPNIIDQLIKIYNTLMNSWSVVLGGAITYLFMQNKNKE